MKRQLSRKGIIVVINDSVTRTGNAPRKRSLKGRRLPPGS
jgi:hypothetical protein